MSDLSLLPSNAVAINGTRPVTTSLVIADVFGKRHDNVLRDIETLECSDTFRLLNFEERNRELVTGKNTVQEYRYFDITKDGFVFLVMGYRGPKAAQFKEAYEENADLVGAINVLRAGHARLACGDTLLVGASAQEPAEATIRELACA